MFGLAGLKLYGAIGVAVVVALLCAWVWRIDSLRASYKQQLANCQANHAQFVADVRAKAAQAQAADAANKAQVENAQAKVSQENDSEIRQRIAAAVAAVRVRVQPVATPAHPGSSGDARVSQAPDPAVDPAGASQTAIVPASDLTTCATNTVKDEGWQAWWKSVQTIPR